MAKPYTPTHNFKHCVNTMPPKHPALVETGDGWVDEAKTKRANHPAHGAGCANIWYPSVRAMQELKPDAMNAHRMREFSGSPGNPADSDWFGDGFEWGTEIDALTVDGWPAGCKRVIELSNKIRLQPATSIRRKITRGESGEHLDMAEVYQGRLDKAWSSKKRKQPGVRSIAIAIQLGDNCGIEANIMYWRGACCLALAKNFMSAGYAVQIVGYTLTRRGYDDVKEYFCEMFPIKQYQDDLNLNTLATAICCAGFFRWVMFRAFTAQPHICDGGLGQSIQADPPMLHNTDNNVFGADHIVKSFQHVRNEESALKKIKSEVDRLLKATMKITTEVKTC